MTQTHISHAVRFAVSSRETAAMDTAALRENFHIGGIFQPGEISLTYTHYDRMIVGGAMPTSGALPLEAIRPTGTKRFLDRRELIAFNIGGSGSVTVSGTRHDLGNGDMLYVGMGEDLSFASDDPDGPAKFYLLSAPAHRSYPTSLIRIGEAKRLDLGSQATSNERSIYQYIHADGVKTCQLVAGMTRLAPGSVWNTMPAHVHDRRMEVYLYFDLPDTARAFHFLGEPSETRHIVMANEEAVLSPPWSIHSGCGTASYAFVWAMAGDNVDYTDVEPVSLETLR